MRQFVDVLNMPAKNYMNYISIAVCNPIITFNVKYNNHVTLLPSCGEVVYVTVYDFFVFKVT